MPKLDKLLLGASLSALGTAALASETITYTYDVHGRLVQVSRSGSVNNGVNSQYSDDHSNNRSNYASGIGSRPLRGGGPGRAALSAEIR